MSEEKIPEHQHSNVDVRNLSAPILTIVSLAGFIFWATTGIWNEKQDLKDMVKTEVSIVKQQHEGEMRQIEEIVTQMQLVIVELRERQHFLLENLISKKDMLIWCGELEKKNANFQCPEYQALKELGLLGTYEYHGINSSTKQGTRNKMLEDMRQDEESGYNIFNRRLPRHNPDAPAYEKK